MKSNLFENRSYSITVTVIAILLLLTGGWIMTRNKSYKNQLKDSNIKTEALASENLSLIKSAEKLQAEINSLNGQIKVMEGSLEETNRKIASKEAEISRLRRHNTDAAVLAKKIKELEELKSDQDRQITALSQNMEQLNQKNTELNGLVSDLQKKNSVLAQNNQILVAMQSNNQRTEALRGKKEKLTAFARCTKKIVVNVDVPSEAVPDISFRVNTPAGNEFTSVKDKNLEVKIPEGQSAGAQTASLKLNEEIISMKKVELVFTREEKLVKGIYIFDIYNKDTYSGSIQIRLK